MRVDEILEKYRNGKAISNEELDFLLNKVDKICSLMTDFPKEYLLFRHELWRLQDDFGLLKISREAKNVVVRGENNE